MKILLCIRQHAHRGLRLAQLVVDVDERLDGSLGTLQGGRREMVVANEWG